MQALHNSDVYFVTVTQALDWIKQPTRLINIHNFESWQCQLPHKGSIRPCEVCIFEANFSNEANEMLDILGHIILYLMISAIFYDKSSTAVG